jgi:hypothetical protein
MLVATVVFVLENDCCIPNMTHRLIKKRTAQIKPTTANSNSMMLNVNVSQSENFVSTQQNSER